MRGERRAVRIFHLVGVAVVGGQEHAAAHIANGLPNGFHAGVNRLDRLHRRVEHAGVTHHVTVREIEDHHVVFAAADALGALVGHLVGAHLRLEVIGGDLRAGDDLAILALVGRFHAAVEEERHVGVFFRLRDAKLRLAVLGEVFAQHVGQLHRRIGDLDIRHGRVIFRHADIVHGEAAIAALEALEIVIHKDAGDLARAIRAEVDEHNRVALLNTAALAGDARHDELIRHVVGVALFDGLHRAARVVALAVDERRVGLLLAIPVGIAVHRVVAAGDGRDFAHADLVELLLKVGDEALAGMRVGVAAVHDAVHVDLLRAQMLGQIEQAEQVVDVAVHAARAEQTHQVNGLARVDGRAHVAHQHVVFLHRAIHDGLGNQRQLLIDDAARAHVGVADLAVAHLPFRQADRHAGGLNRGIGIGFKQTVEVRPLGRRNRIAERLLRHPAEAVHDAKQNRFLCHTCSFMRRNARPWRNPPP